MKVKELIEELSRYNPNAEVECTYSNDTFNINEIEVIGNIFDNYELLESEE